MIQPARKIFPWNDHWHSTLRNLWNNTTLTARQIASIIGCSRNAVIGKANRLGLLKKASPIKKPGQSPTQDDITKLKMAGLEIPVPEETIDFVRRFMTHKPYKPYHKVGGSKLINAPARFDTYKSRVPDMEEKECINPNCRFFAVPGSIACYTCAPNLIAANRKFLQGVLTRQDKPIYIKEAC